MNYAAEWPDDPGDEAILLLAVSEQRVAITRDKDLANLCSATFNRTSDFYGCSN